LGILTVLEIEECAASCEVLGGKSPELISYAESIPNTPIIHITMNNLEPFM
jgi:hypothetical protein